MAGYSLLAGGSILYYWRYLDYDLVEGFLMERKLQLEVIGFLKSNGCWTMKTRPGMGTPVGTADIFFCKEGFYGWIEVKSGIKAPFRTFQQEFIKKMDDWSYARTVYPENWDSIRSELSGIL